jgi:hypothetical protein
MLRAQLELKSNNDSCFIASYLEDWVPCKLFVMNSWNER